MSPGRRVSAILKRGRSCSLGKNYSSRGPGQVLVGHRAADCRRRGTTSGWTRAARDRRADHHAAAARRLSQAGQSAVVGAGTARPGLEVRRETVDSATLVIKPGWGFSFDYQPGQYVGIGVLIDGRWRWRSYSLTSSPGATGRLAHHHHHGQGDARGLPVDPPGRRGGARHDRSAGRAAGQLRDARPGAGLGAVPHRRARASRR